MLTRRTGSIVSILLYSLVSIHLSTSEALSESNCPTFNEIDVGEWDGELRNRITIEPTSNQPSKRIWVCPRSTELAGKQIIHSEELSYRCFSGRCDQTGKPGKGELWSASETVSSTLADGGEDGTINWHVTWRFPANSLDINAMREGLRAKYDHLDRPGGRTRTALVQLECKIDGRDYWVDIDTELGRSFWLLKLHVNRVRHNVKEGFRFDDEFEQHHCMSDQKIIDIPF